MKYVDSSDTNNVLESYSYTYDNNSNIKSKTTVNNYPSKSSDKINETKKYEYDTLGRLTKTDITNNSTNAKSTISYGYDKAGNRISMTKDGATTNYSYNKLDQLTKSTESKDGKETSNKTYTYDLNGNQTKEKDSTTNVTVENTYDVDNRLSTSITVNGTKEVVNQQNLYSGNGQRIQKKEGSSVVNYFYQDGVVLYTSDKDGNKTSQNFVGTEGNVIGTTRYSTDGFKYYTYNKDVQGSTTSVVGQDGTSPVQYDYDDFGVTKTIGDGTFFNEVCYTGGIYDVSTGLYYLNARYYDPRNGRFITRDTYRGELNKPDTQHLYAYCENNPINYVDPSGHKRTKFSWNKAYKLVKNIMNSKTIRITLLVLSIVSIGHLAVNIVRLVIVLSPYISSGSFNIAVVMILSRPKIAFSVCNRIRSVASGIKNAFTLKKKIKSAQGR